MSESFVICDGWLLCALIYEQLDSRNDDWLGTAVRADITERIGNGTHPRNLLLNHES